MPNKKSSRHNSHSAFSSNPTRRMLHSVKAEHDARRTLLERMADAMADAFGSITFLILNSVLFAVWILINIGAVPGLPAFDPFPFGLLTMIVSLEAIILSIFVLISQNRVSKVDALREEVDLQVDIITEQELTKIMRLLVRLLEKQGITVAGDKELREMLKDLNTSKIEKVLEQQIT